MAEFRSFINFNSFTTINVCLGVYVYEWIKDKKRRKQHSPAIDSDMITADVNNNGFRPALSTTNNAKMLLINWTSPTRIVAKWSFTELPKKNNSDKISN